MARLNLRLAFCALALAATPFLGGCVVTWPLLAAQFLLSDNALPVNGNGLTPESIRGLYQPVSVAPNSRAS